MRVALALALFGAVACTAASMQDIHDSVHVLDELAMVEVDNSPTPACQNEIRQAKTKCGEQQAYYKKIEETKCGSTELAAVMDRIKSNHKRAAELNSQLKSAETKLRQSQFEETRYKGAAVAAKAKVLQAMVTQIHQQDADKSAEAKVQAELKDMSSTRYKANAATTEAEKLAGSEPTMAKVTPAAEKAKGLWAQMVQEKVNVARAKYMAKQGKNAEHITDAKVRKLFDEAVKARAQEMKGLKTVQKASKEVAKDNAKITEKETTIAKEEKQASEKEEATYAGKEKKIQAELKKEKTQVNGDKKKVKKLKTEVQSVEAEANKVGHLNLKGLLAKAGNMLKP